MASPGAPSSSVVVVERVCTEAGSADELFAGLSEAVGRAVAHEGAMWFGVDPVTMLPTSPTRIEGVASSDCAGFWHREFTDHDALLFSDVARSTEPVATMRDVLDGRMARSARYRDFMAPEGFDDELRAAFRSGDSVWGLLGLYRERGRPPFEAADRAYVAAIAPLVARALRVHARAASPWVPWADGPGLVLVDHDGWAVSVNDEARTWLDELWTDAGTSPVDGIANVLAAREQRTDVVTPLCSLVARARAVRAGRESAPAKLRLRDRRGRWLLLHASSLAGPTGEDHGMVALVIEPAKSAEIAPIVIEAYALTARERDVVAAVARGGSTVEIAEELYLSPHTVRDHVKTVFEKVGVSSRGELVARLFAEHYAGPHQATVVRTS